MENKINIAQLLKDCPKGMELDCTMWNNVRLKCVDFRFLYPIVITYPVGEELFTAELTEYGCWSPAESAKCVIFPKSKTTWEGFVPPCEFKSGDIIFTLCNSGNTWISIFKKKGAFGEVETYADYYSDANDEDLDNCCVNNYGASLCKEEDIAAQRLATEEEKEKLLKAIEDKGYRWNAETKTLEELIEPKFKVGDKIKLKNGGSILEVTSINNDGSICINGMSSLTIKIKQQNNYELVPDKFDINTLVPFESKVLARDCDKDRWHPGIWGFYDKGEINYPYKLIGDIVRYCIPYERNEHLLGKTDDCDKFYKTWE